MIKRRVFLSFVAIAFAAFTNVYAASSLNNRVLCEQAEESSHKHLVAHALSDVSKDLKHAVYLEKKKLVNSAACSVDTTPDRLPHVSSAAKITVLSLAFAGLVAMCFLLYAQLGHAREQISDLENINHIVAGHVQNAERDRNLAERRANAAELRSRNDADRLLNEEQRRLAAELRVQQLLRELDALRSHVGRGVNDDARTMREAFIALGLNPDGVHTKNEVNKRYHQLALALHPDKAREVPPEVLQSINNAIALLRVRCPAT